MIDTSNEHKNKIKAIETAIIRINEELLIQKDKQAMLE